MILMPQIFNVIANGNRLNKCDKQELSEDNEVRREATKLK